MKSSICLYLLIIFFSYIKAIIVMIRNSQNFIWGYFLYFLVFVKGFLCQKLISISDDLTENTYIIKLYIYFFFNLQANTAITYCTSSSLVII